MTEEIYSTYEAKARFSEVLRKVGRNKTVVITSRGKPVAEIVPFVQKTEGLEQRLERLEKDGFVDRGISSPEWFEPVVGRDGALERFKQGRR